MVEISWPLGAQFGVVVDDIYSPMLRLPPKFSRQMPRKYACPAYLIHGCRMWKVQIETGTAKNASYITAGWPNFAKDFISRENTVITFKHMGNLNFKVKCLKIYKGQNNFTCFEEKSYEKLDKQHTMRKGDCDELLHLGGNTGFEILQENPMHMEMDDIVPTPFEREIKGHRKKQVTIPSQFARDAKLHNKSQIMLLQPEIMRVGQGTIRMGCGWPVFCGQHNVRDGDFCTFSLNTNCTNRNMVYVNVSIRRKMEQGSKNSE